MLGTLLAVAIELLGVTGKDLRARAFFDANNVKVGDPLVLTIDFLGDADFKDIHPPALSRHLDRHDWKLDDASAKTDTFRDARRVTYRIRPMREGLIYFPALSFTYAGPDGAPREVRANEIPVHAKVGAQVVVAEMGEDVREGPKLPAYQAAADFAAPGLTLTDDASFAWRKACATPTADAFAAFDFPAAKLNEAAAALREGNWARALSVYRRLEWRIGQTPEIEQGILAALALRYDNPSVELPIWRQVLRPVLKHNWLGRVGIVAGGFAALALIFWLVGRGIRAVACLALVLAPACLALAQDPFAAFDKIFEEQRKRMQQMMNQPFGGGFSMSVDGEGQRKPQIRALLTIDKPNVRVGENFHFILAIESEKNATLDQVRLLASNDFGLTFTGEAENLPSVASANGSNVVRRISLPARYDVPYTGKIAFTIDGMVTGRRTRNGGRFSFSFSNSFRVKTPEIAIKVQPLPSANQPPDYTGIVSEGLALHEYCDFLNVETNDVVTITYRLVPRGYVPAGYLLPGAAFEWNHQQDAAKRTTEIAFRRFFVANGTNATPRVSVPYYDPRTKTYKRVEAGGTPLVYVAP